MKELQLHHEITQFFHGRTHTTINKSRDESAEVGGRWWRDGWWVFGGVCLISVERRSGGLVGWRCVSVMVDGT